MPSNIEVAAPDPEQARPGKFRTGLYPALGVVLILAVAAVIRDIYLLQYRSALPYYSTPLLDARYYDEWAQSVASGKGYGPMPFYMAPLYPYFLALVYRLFGHSYSVVYAIQQVLGLLGMLLVYLIGRRIFGQAAGLLAMALMALYGPLVFLESKLMSETLGITLGLTALLLLIRAMDRPTALRFMCAGLTLGLSALCRPAALIFIALIFVWMHVRRRTLRTDGIIPLHALVLAVGVVLAISPVTVRNYLASGNFVPISTSGGIVFAQGNNPAANGLERPLPGFTTAIATQQEEEMRIASERLGHPVGPAQSSVYWFGQGMEFIREHPERYALLLGKKLVLALHSREPGLTYNIAFEKLFMPVLQVLFLPFAVLSGLGLYGFLSAPRNGPRPEAELPALQTSAVLLSMLVFSVCSRYRAPMVPSLAILAGNGVIAMVDQLRRREFGRVGIAAALVIVMGLISLAPYPTAPVTASDYGNLGLLYMYQDDLTNAVEYLEKALDADPNSAAAHMNMGRALTRTGDLHAGIEWYRRGLEIAPNDYRLHFLLGNNLLGTSQEVEAVVEYKKALKISPTNLDARISLSTAYSNLGKYDDAAGELREVIRQSAGTAEAHASLAYVLYSQGKYRESWREVHLAKRCGWKPDHGFLDDLKSKMPDPGE